MMRLILLSICGAIVFCGFAMPFLLQGFIAWLLCLALILSGSSLLWWIEIKSSAALDQDNCLNRILKVDNEDIS